ncbi:MAG: acyl-CoA dehydratase activase [Thermodesulfobacteriota bacterium]
MSFDVGVDIGSVSINCVALNQDREIVFEAPYKRHFGMIIEETEQTLQEVLHKLGEDNVRSVSFTGSQGQYLSQLLQAPFEVETIAQVLGCTQTVPGVRSIISIGGQDAALFQLNYDHEGNWYLESFNMNSPCASGTGSFIDQQAERLSYAMYGFEFEMSQDKLQEVLNDFIAMGLQSTYPAPVACRCTVFTKSDMIHLQNKGETLSNIIAGLHHGTAANYMSTIVSNRTLEEPIVFVGGMASNALLVRAFREYFPNLIVPEEHSSMGALGVALQAAFKGWKNRLDLDFLHQAQEQEGEGFPRSTPLSLELTSFPQENSLDARPGSKRPKQAWLGVDVGSTSTKYALIDAQGNILDKSYVATQGKPIEVTQSLLQNLLQNMGSGVRLLGVGTTGSGRNVVGDFLDADLIIDEITAHARGAVNIDPEIDTIFEIGGQDSKYISLDRTYPVDFVMNKICAAGTGSFLHELANKMKINIVNQFQEVALQAENPVHLTERCTVFMESDLVSYFQKGARRDDLLAGLCFAIVHNYLHRVVENRHIGEKIMFLGGPSLNKGIVAAFEKVLKKPIIVPKHREVMGAYGTALAVLEKFNQEEVKPKTRALEELARITVDFEEKVCRADKNCHNECKLKIYKFGDRKSIWGGDCGRYEARHLEGRAEENYFKLREKIFQDYLFQGQNILEFKQEARSDAPVIGVPLALHSLEWGIFWSHIFSGLGYQVRLTPPTDQRMVSLGLEAMTAETCFPIKVFHGHVSYILDRADYLFLPNPINIPTPSQEERGVFCPMVESSQYLVRAALNIPDEKLIRPNMFLREGPEDAVFRLQKALPAELQPKRKQLQEAVHAAWQQQMDFRGALLEKGKEILEDHDSRQPLWIVSGRPYNLYDDRLNLKLGRHLAKLGIKALPQDFLDFEQENLQDFPRMYWGLGSRILRVAKMVARNPNWYGVHLTNFSCGPDSFLEHFYDYVLQHKPALILELDEHSAVAGILTRIEAYNNVVKNLQQYQAEDLVQTAGEDKLVQAG